MSVSWTIRPTVTRDCDNLLVDCQKQFRTNTHVFDLVFRFPSFIHTMIFICVSLFNIKRYSIMI